MNIDTLSKKWRRLDPVPFNDISAARDMAHEAVQLMASAAISFVPAKQDDSHTNFEWSRSLKALVGSLFGENNEICLGINISDLKLLMLGENWIIKNELQLNNKSLDDAVTWMDKSLTQYSIDFRNFSLNKHYEIPVNTVFNGGHFFVENEIAFQELSDYYANADLIIRGFIGNETIATAVRCWPHHFDIASLLNIGNENLQSIGIGMSPGDKYNNEPYFYVTMWPYPDLESIKFTEIPYGIWNYKGWVGSALKASELIQYTDEKMQCNMVAEFFQDSVEVIKNSMLKR